MILRTFFILVLNFSALAVGGLFTSSGVKSEWYNLLRKAPWTPPGWVFGFAWTLIMICFAFYISLLWETTRERKTLILLFTIQWVLNVCWNPIFFKFHQVNVALLIITLLTILIGYMQFKYMKELQGKSLLISPYFLWLIIATSLNAYININN